MFYFGYGNDSLLFGGDPSLSTSGLPSYDFSMPDSFSTGYQAPSLSLDSVPSMTPTPTSTQDSGKSWLDSLTSPNVLGAAITAGAGLFGGLSQIDQQREAQKSAQEQQKMNNLLELAKLKYQLTKGGTGSGRASGGSRGPTRGEIDAQYRSALANSYNTVGSGIAGVY